jgi:hypothetical protein
MDSHLSGNILRVREMRRWFDLGLSNDVPSVAGYDRFDTVVPVRQVDGHPEVTFDDQSDNTPKALRPNSSPSGMARSSCTAPGAVQAGCHQMGPHPVLCSPLGPIAILRDHVHEDLVREDDEVELNGLDAYGAPESPAAPIALGRKSLPLSSRRGWPRPSTN